jgi:hypothetical protein
MLLRTLIATAVLATNVSAECVLQESTINTFDGVVEQRDSIVRDIIPVNSNTLKCMVRYKAKVNGEWHTTTGEYTYTDKNSQMACGQAVINADKNLLTRLSNNHLSSQQVLVCHDDDKQMTLHKTDIGTLGLLSQYRPHPDYPDNFNYKGSSCRWFLDVEFNGDVKPYEGIICNVQEDKWVVVDKF